MVDHVIGSVTSDTANRTFMCPLRDQGGFCGVTVSIGKGSVFDHGAVVAALEAHVHNHECRVTFACTRRCCTALRVAGATRYTWKQLTQHWRNSVGQDELCSKLRSILAMAANRYPHLMARKGPNGPRQIIREAADKLYAILDSPNSYQQNAAIDFGIEPRLAQGDDPSIISDDEDDGSPSVIF